MSTRPNQRRPGALPFFPVTPPTQTAAATGRRGLRSQKSSEEVAAAFSRGNPSPSGSMSAGQDAMEIEGAIHQGVYIISVACRLLEMHPQTLRKYERIGLISPSRTVGMLRLYSDEDIARLRMIKYLVEERGMNLAGVEMALTLVSRLLGVRRLVDELRGGNEGARNLLHQQLEGIMEMLRFPGTRGR